MGNKSLTGGYDFRLHVGCPDCGSKVSKSEPTDGSDIIRKGTWYLYLDGRLNSSKNNKLPDWNMYFPRLANKQYFLYKQVFNNDVARYKFEKCRKDNLNSIWATESLFVEGNTEEQFKSVLEHNLKPIYELAKLQGYDVWKVV